MHTDQQKLRQKIIQQTDLCVKCGMCSNQCPTYLIKQDENESPRGRITLAQALASSTLNNDIKVREHISTCLSCMRCEKTCPSKVPYQQILDNTRQLLAQEKPENQRLVKIVSNLTFSQWSKIATLIRFASNTGLMKILSFIFTTKYRNYLRPTAKLPKSESHKESVQIFAGCLSNIFDQSTMVSLVSLLDACEINALFPANQKCCGALATHKGLVNEAENCRISNEATFNDDKPILFTTSGCGAHLNGIAKLDGQSVFANLENASQFLVKHKNFANLSFASLNKTVLIHSPCTEKNVLKKSSSLDLLKNIPSLKLISLPENTSCCGAAGSYMVEHPQESFQIRELTLKEIIKIKPDVLVSSNYPCAMHLSAGLKEKGLDIEVVHPLRLLQQQLMRR